jgi:hypothetical protein
MVGLSPKDLHGGNSANPSDGWFVSKRPPFEATASTPAMVDLFQYETAPIPVKAGMFSKTSLEGSSVNPSDG